MMLRESKQEVTVIGGCGQPQDVSVKAGEITAFRVTVTGAAPLTYQWMINKNDGNGFVNIRDAVDSSYTTSVTDMDCNGFQYKCVVTNAKSSVENNVVTLTVPTTEPENREYHILNGADQSIMENYDGTITIRVDRDIRKFVSVAMDETIVDVCLRESIR